MTEMMLLAPPLLAAGMCLGAVFFGGLWWTVRRGISAREPVLWFFPSALARMSVAMTGLYFIGRDDWVRWALGLAGFLFARLLIKRLVRTRALSHAP